MYFHLNRVSVFNQLFQTYLPGSLPMFSHQKTRKDAQKRHGDSSVPANTSDAALGACCSCARRVPGRKGRLRGLLSQRGPVAVRAGGHLDQEP